MVLPVVGGNESKGYEISNSLRFNDDDSPKLEASLSTPDSRRNLTVSFWIKRSNLPSATRNVWSVGTANGNVGVAIGFLNTHELYIYDYDGGTDYGYKIADRAFRDPSAWYHVLIAVDTTQGTASNRAKFYVNGVLQTTTATWGDFPQNHDLNVNANSNKHSIGTTPFDTVHWDGYLTEVNHIDGITKANTDFGEFDDNAVWVPIKYTGGYGTNGYFLQFKQTGTSQNSSGIGADTSGEDNHFAVTNLAATDITEDTCTNNFCTMSSIDTNTQASLSEGNTQLQRGSNYAGCNGTFGVSSGKWYWEVKTPSPTGSGENSGFGVTKVPHATIGNNYLGYQNSTEWAIFIDNAASDIYKIHGNSTSDYSVDASSNDIFQIALDMDNNKIYFGRNGTYFASGNPAGNSNEAYSSVSGDPFLFPAFSMNGNDTLQVNFGNPAFSISSGNNDGKYGNFEYAPPSGFYALCTKRLAEFG